MCLCERVKERDIVTRLGDFLKFLVTNFLTKVAQIFGDYLGYFEKSKEKKTALGTF